MAGVSNTLCLIGIVSVTYGLYTERPSLAYLFVGVVLCCVGVSMFRTRKSAE